MNKQQFLAMSAITSLKGFVDGRSTHAGPTVYTLHSVPNKCKTVQIAASMNEDEFYVDIDKFKPILHPLSDLTKEIVHKGERFVPLRKLLEASGFDLSVMGQVLINEYERIFSDIQLLGISDVILLGEWHFNLMGEGEEFIDVNTLDINPYK